MLGRKNGQTYRMRVNGAVAEDMFLSYSSKGSSEEHRLRLKPTGPLPSSKRAPRSVLSSV